MKTLLKAAALGLALSLACSTVQAAPAGQYGVAGKRASDPDPEVAAKLDAGLAALNGGDTAQAIAILEPLAQKNNLKAQYLVSIAYSRQEKPESAAKWMTRAAEGGIVDAGYHLGTMYEAGRGVERDFGAARFWFQRAADHGSAGAQNGLGVMYRGGEGVPVDYAMARNWFQKAADQGFAEAYFNMAKLYYVGQGVPQDYALSANWLEKAANSGVTEAQSILGALYMIGVGVPQNDVIAYKWLSLAIRDGRPVPTDAVSDKAELMARMTAEQVAQGDAAVAAWRVGR